MQLQCLINATLITCLVGALPWDESFWLLIGTNLRTKDKILNCLAVQGSYHFCSTKLKQVIKGDAIIIHSLIAPQLTITLMQVTITSIDFIPYDWTEINGIFDCCHVLLQATLEQIDTREGSWFTHTIAYVSSKALYSNRFVLAIILLKVSVSFRHQESFMPVPICCLIPYLGWMGFNRARRWILNLVNPF
jgi:hypothetical protein